ncbi:MAG TPA: PQQ-dependent sugar dehydrogenase [Gemmatimonadales bacterium]|nr:PQQ-dependent sugar dehydrogenase [Gemmatimonadales bacterium]
MTEFSRASIGPRLAVLALVAIGAACSDSSGPTGGHRPPIVTITSPTAASVAVGTPVKLAGTATDYRDSLIHGSALSWTSSINGALGTGDSLTVSTLSTGRHTIRLIATDDSGTTGFATRILNVTPPPPTLGLDTVANGLSGAVYLVGAPGDTSRLFVVEQSGVIRIIKSGTLLPTPFLDISSAVLCCGEEGLLGLAFDPNYQVNGRFYISYDSLRPSPDTGAQSVIARFTVSGNPDVANTSGQTILTVNQPFSNHKGGMITFGADGYLYIGFGDGGSGGDPFGTGQNRTDLLGSMLRIDVSGSGTYTIPSTNPYATNATFRHELWNYGLRNPWRWSFDRQTHDLYIGDVGQDLYEEIDVQPATSSGGEDYGWNIMEGTHCYNASSCNETGLTLPVLDYDHTNACAVVGGYVYRGSAIPALQGTYLYGDYCGGWVRSFVWSAGIATQQKDQPDLSPGSAITSFGEDTRGEVYIVLASGTILKIVGR